jgi:hypothetical protein
MAGEKLLFEYDAMGNIKLAEYLSYDKTLRITCRKGK